MSVILVGGGDGGGVDAALARFLADARAHAAGVGRDRLAPSGVGGGLRRGGRVAVEPARVVIVGVGAGDEPERQAAWWVNKLRALDVATSAAAPRRRPPIELRTTLGRADDGTAGGTTGEPIDRAALLGVDGMLVAGGRASAVLAVLADTAVDVRRLVSEGVSYLGAGAGAVVAADRAIVGGWRIGGVPVCPPDVGEGVDEVAVEAGLGLIDLAIDAHAAQRGTLARAIAAAEAGLIDRALAIDDDTALVVGDGGLEIVGSGSVWQVRAADGSVAVSSGRAS